MSFDQNAVAKFSEIFELNSLKYRMSDMGYYQGIHICVTVSKGVNCMREISRL